VYNKIKDSELYKQGGKNRKVIKNLWRRKQISFQLDQENFSAENKNFLQIALVKLIPETIKDDNGEQALTELENQLKTFKTASESEEKGQIYQKYQKTIDQVLNEIRVEKQRYQQAKQQVEEEKPTLGDNQNADSRLPIWAQGLIIIGVVVVVGTVFLVSILHFYRRRGRKNSTKKSI
jgi:arginyl-tRNA--protein-N-Asp/Glu arginylyltransferase